MSHIAMLLPREALVQQVKEIMKDYPDLKEVRCVTTKHAVEEAKAAVREGASVIIARGLQSIVIGNALNVPLVDIRMTAQEIGLLIMKVKHFSTAPRPKIALIAAINTLCDTKACNILFNVDLRVFSYSTMEEYGSANQKAVDWQPDAIIGGELSEDVARRNGIAFQFLDANEESLIEAIRMAEKLFTVNEQNRRMNAQIDTMLNGQTNGIMELDTSGRIVKTNNIMLEMLMMTKKQLIGSSVVSIFPSITQERLDDLLLHKESYSTFLHIQYQAVVVILTPVYLPDGRAEGVMLSCYRVHRSFQIEGGSEERLLAGKGVKTGDLFDEIHHRSPAMAHVIDLAKRFSTSDRPILIAGERGLECNLLAQCIHSNSRNCAGPFVHVNCGALTLEEQIRVLFGTGVTKENGEKDLGAFGMANNGTLFIREIEHLSPQAQAKLYYTIHHQKIFYYNVEQTAQVNVRVIATCTRELAEMRNEGTFRADLYYYLSGLRLTIPALRDRPEDLEDVLDDTFERISEEYQEHHVLTSGAWEELRHYEWKGNIIQIHSFIDRLMLTCRERTVDTGMIRRLYQGMFPDLPVKPGTGSVSGAEIRTAGPAAPAQTEEDPVRSALRQCGGSRIEAAKLLGISTTTLWRRMKKLGISGYGRI